MLPSNEVSKTVSSITQKHWSSINVLPPHPTQTYLCQTWWPFWWQNHHLHQKHQQNTSKLWLPKFKTKIIIQTSIFGVQHVNFLRVYPKNLHLEVPCPTPHQDSQVSTAKWMHHAKHMDEIPRSIQGKARLLGIGIHHERLWPWPAHRPRSHRCRYKTHMYVTITIWLYVIAIGYVGYT